LVLAAQRVEGAAVPVVIMAALVLIPLLVVAVAMVAVAVERELEYPDILIRLELVALQ
jgi:hypothetical protein